MRPATVFVAVAALLVGAGVGGALWLAPAEAQDVKPPAAPPPAPAAPDKPHPLEGLWELRMERKVWWPYRVPGTLAVFRGPGGLRASVTFDPMWGIDPVHVTLAPVVGDELRFFVDIREDHLVRVEGTVRDGIFTGQAHWDSAEPPEVSFVSAERLPAARRFEPDTTPDAFPLETDPAKAGVDPVALDRLILYANRFDTDALVVVKDGKLLCDRTFLRPRGLCTMQSVTKPIASLAIPLLIEEGKLPRDLDTPLTTWYPEWKDDARKSKITLRHVLTHTTGLESDGTVKMQSQGNYLAFALRSAAVDEPGTKWAYSNQAMELLSGIIAKAAGMQADVYLDAKVFRPLGISTWRWSRDGAGNTHTYAGLDLAAADVARIGEMVGRRGRVGDKQIVPEWWFDAIAKPGDVNEEVGLVWWLKRDKANEQVEQTQARLDRLRAAGFAGADRLKPMVGQTFASRDAWWKAARDILGKDGTQELGKVLGHENVGGVLRGPVTCVYHTGSMGQYLLVYPEQHLVVVRQRRGFAWNELSEDAQSRAGFGDLPDLVRDLLIR